MRRAALANLLWLALALPAAAHEVRPSYLEVHEESPGILGVLWKTPMQGDYRLALEPSFSARVTVLTPVIERRAGGSSIRTWTMSVEGPLEGTTVGIDGLDHTLTDALVRIELPGGRSWVERLTPDRPRAEIPRSVGAADAAVVYFRLGVEHILLGIDHLLFVLALVMITSGTRRLITTITAFTAAHSITLALAATGVVHVAPAPVEAVIALSIVLVAVEILRLREGKGGLTARAPWLVAFAFGLLHGFGFAGALSRIGLPEGQVPLALFSFNVGVEAGQLLFIGGVLSVVALVRRIERRLPRWTELVPPYAIGTAAMFWVIQRIAAF